MKIDKKCVLDILKFYEEKFIFPSTLIINASIYENTPKLNKLYDYRFFSYHLNYIYNRGYISECTPDSCGAFRIGDLTQAGRDYLERYSLKGRITFLYSFIYKFFPLFWILLQIFNYFYKIVPSSAKQL